MPEPPLASGLLPATFCNCYRTYAQGQTIYGMACSGLVVLGSARWSTPSHGMVERWRNPSLLFYAVVKSKVHPPEICPTSRLFESQQNNAQLPFGESPIKFPNPVSYGAGGAGAARFGTTLNCVGRKLPATIWVFCGKCEPA
jgi:hypothetical protein